MKSFLTKQLSLTNFQFSRFSASTKQDIIRALAKFRHFQLKKVGGKVGAKAGDIWVISAKK
jgi:hypothetical protein